MNNPSARRIHLPVLGAWTGSTIGQVVLLVALLVFVVFGDVPVRTRFWETLFDSGHTALFGVVALLIRRLVARRGPPPIAAHASVVALGASLVLGAATEILQMFQPGRDASLVDFLRDAAGAGAFLLLAAVHRARRQDHATSWKRTTRVAAALAAVVLLAAAGAELAATIGLYAARDRAFPTLFALDGSWWERQLVVAGRNRLTPGRGPAGGTTPAPLPLARLDLEPGTYPGLTFDEPYPDWRGFRWLTFTIVSDLETDFRMSIRVHDAAHDQRYADRFNRELRIKPGVNRFMISIDDIRRAPDRREMDLRQVRGIVLFAYKLGHPAHVYLGPLRLEW